MTLPVFLPILQNPTVQPAFTSVPQQVSIEITGRCNLRCHHCFNESSPSSPHELPLAHIERFLDDVQTWGVRIIRITGGEPTVHRQFAEILEACRRRAIGLGLNTNGIYTEDLLRYLVTAPDDMFFISIDGMEANNDAIRGHGTFKRAVDSCRVLKTAGRNVMIGFHVGEGNRSDVPELLALAAELGVDVKIAPLRPVGRAVRELPHFLIQPRSFYEVVQQITRLRRAYTDIRIYTDFDLLDGPPASDCSRDPNRASCAAGRSLLNVRSDGAINPCAFFDAAGPSFVAGNITRDSATAVWQDPTSFQAFRVQEKSETCHRCDHYERRCQGGCPAISYGVSGYLDTLDPTCFADLIQPETFDALARSIPPLPFAQLVAPPEIDEGAG